MAPAVCHVLCCMRLWLYRCVGVWVGPIQGSLLYVSGQRQSRQQLLTLVQHSRCSLQACPVLLR
jgi:hypothetical protein